MSSKFYILKDVCVEGYGLKGLIMRMIIRKEEFIVTIFYIPNIASDTAYTSHTKDFSNDKECISFEINNFIKVYMELSITRRHSFQTQLDILVFLITSELRMLQYLLSLC